MEQIKQTIEQLEEYMSKDQHEDLVRLLNFGENWKEKGEELKQSWWKEHHDRNLFRKRCAGYHDLLTQREEENNDELEKIGYTKMDGLLKMKYEEEFLKQAILYSGTTPEIDQKEIKGLDAVLEYLKRGKQERGVTLDLRQNSLGDAGAKALAEMLEKMGGLREGVTLDLRLNNFGDEGVKALAEMLERTGGLKEGVRLDLNNTRIGDAGVKAIAEMLESTGGLKEGVRLDLYHTNVGDAGVKALARAIENTGGLREGVLFDLMNTQIGDEGAKVLARAIEKTGGLRAGVTLDLNNTQIGDEGAKVLARAIEKTGGLRAGVTLDLRATKISIETNLSKETKKLLQQLNASGKGKIWF